MRLQQSAVSEDSEARIKLRMLESKRAEDAKRINELETRLAEADVFLSFKPKLQAKLQALQAENASYKRENADLKVEKDALEAERETVNEQLEMSMLDKEVAEERAEAAEAELEVERELRAESEVELNVLKSGGGGTRRDGDGDDEGEGDGDGGGDGAKSSLDYIQLEKQNERLKEALIR